MKFRHLSLLLPIFLISLLILQFFSCNGKASQKSYLVATEVPVNSNGVDPGFAESDRFIPRSRIVVFSPGKNTKVKVLTDDFFSAGFPSASYDGRHMLFAGQKGKDDPWLIWEMDLNNLKYTNIVRTGNDCTDPAYLPDGGIVFSRKVSNDTVNNALCLFTCRMDGSGLRQITFSPASNLGTTVLRDGRILSVTRHLLPAPGDPMLTVMRPDGTKADIFYGGEKGLKLPGRPSELPDGRIIFAEAVSNGNTGSCLASISYNRPLHSRINLSSGPGGEFCFVLPLNPDLYITSWRKPGSENFALYTFDPVKKLPLEPLLSEPGYSIIDVAEAAEHERQRKLPSEVDMQVKTGLLLCQDINFVNPLQHRSGNPIAEAAKIEIVGIDTTYGVIPVDEDGSFYLKVMADMPFRIITLDERGNRLNDTCSWLWLRPNERRGCVGCHDDPELVPENKVSLAVRKAPVIVPVHITGIKEKTVELE